MRCLFAHTYSPGLALLCLCFLFVSTPGFADETQLAGTIEAKVGGKLVQFPSLNSRVEVDLQGDLARVRVIQTFENPLSEPVHARYLFPLNKGAAVFSLTMNVGNERISAVIQEKEKAQKTFAAAKKAGKAAALLTAHRPNMFTQKIANLMPGLPIEVIVEYVHTVPKIDGAYELVVPLVVGPRFVPLDVKSTTVSHGLSQTLNSLSDPAVASVPVVGVTLPTSVEASRVALDIRLESAIGFSSVTSPTHEIAIEELSGAVRRVGLAEASAIANRDFILRYQLGSANTLESGVLSYADERGGFFSLMIEPPKRWQDAQVLPREMVFLLDCSGSMQGAPMDASKAFMREALKNLRPQDKFRIIRFSDHATEFSREPLDATPGNIADGLRYTDALAGSGGTVMRAGVEQALMVEKPEGFVRNVVFLTDGYIGNEFEILGLVSRELATARLFALGVGTGVNRYLLDELARRGRGFARYLDPGNDVEERASELAMRLQTPLLTDINIDWGDLEVSQQTPALLPDLYAGDSLRVQGRYNHSGQYPISVYGRSAGERVELPMQITLADENASPQARGEAIALIWARSAIREAMHQLSVPQQLRLGEQPEEQIVQQVTQLGLSYSLATRWTSFVAVSEQIYNPNPELADELDVPLAKVASVSRHAYPVSAGTSAPHGGYAAPEPSTWLGMALFALIVMLWLGAPRMRDGLSG